VLNQFACEPLTIEKPDPLTNIRKTPAERLVVGTPLESGLGLGEPGHVFS